MIIASGCGEVADSISDDASAEADAATSVPDPADGGETQPADAEVSESPDAGLAAGDTEPGPHGMTWVFMDGGNFFRGSPDGDPDELPVHEVELSPFWLAQTETTVAQYAVCVDDGACAAPSTNGSCNWGVSGRDDHPVTCVTWFDADAFCEFVGERLPTEAEREFAARSGGDQTYPWGDEDPTCERAVFDDGASGCGEGRTSPVCSKPAGTSEEGVCDLAGNVFEWVNDFYGDYEEGYHVDPTGPENGSNRVLRGGAWDIGAQALRASDRGAAGPTGHFGNLGFRCARPH